MGAVASWGMFSGVRHVRSGLLAGLCGAAVTLAGLLPLSSLDPAAALQVNAQPPHMVVTPAVVAPTEDGTSPTTGTATLASLSETGVNGQASALDTGDMTTFVITLRGLDADTAHAGHIHSGGCNGPILFPLASIHADASGTGQATATVAAPLDTSTWWIQYHAGESPPGPGIACGALQAERSVPMPGVGDRCPTMDGVAVERC